MVSQKSFSAEALSLRENAEGLYSLIPRRNQYLSSIRIEVLTIHGF